MRLRLLACAGALLGVTLSSRADASGLYFSDRGVRPLGRGGAFVAGADDLGAIWYNPAGLSDAGTSFLFDASWLHYTSEFTRQTLVFDGTSATSAGHLYTFPQVHGTSPVLPIPTIAGSYQFGKDKAFTIAAGIFAPYTAITSYPSTLNGQPAPSRYSLVSLDGSALVVSGLYLSYKPIERLRIGAGLQALVGNFDTNVVFSASPPDRLISAPEDPSYDTNSQLKVGPIFSPSANFGIIGIPQDHVRIGASVQLPMYINAPAQVTVVFPGAPVFENAAQNGNAATVRFTLPAVARAGIEYRNRIGGDKEIRVELAYVREFWSEHDSIDIRSNGIQLTGIIGFPSPIGVAPITLPRNFQDSNSVRIGAELFWKAGAYPLSTRVGFSYDQSAIPTNYVSPLTIDSDKFTPSIGGSLYLMEKKLRLDIVYAHVFAADVFVDPSTAAISRVNPVEGNAIKYPESINGGSYSQRADVLGIGLEYKFDFAPAFPKKDDAPPIVALPPASEDIHATPDSPSAPVASPDVAPVSPIAPPVVAPDSAIPTEREAEPAPPPKPVDTKKKPPKKPPKKKPPPPTP